MKGGKKEKRVQEEEDIREVKKHGVKEGKGREMRRKTNE